MITNFEKIQEGSVVIYQNQQHLVTQVWEGNDTNKVQQIRTIDADAEARVIIHRSYDPDLTLPVKKRTNTKLWRERVAKSTASVAFTPSHFSTTIGSDPEVFVLDENGAVLPAFEFLPAKKAAIERYDPNPNYTMRGVGKTFYDGFQGEFTTRNNCFCIGFLTDDIRYGLESVLEYARKKNKHAKLTTKAVVDLPDDAVTRYPREHFTLGCMPSFSAYDEEPLAVADPTMLPYRSAGWHMHFRPSGLFSDKPFEFNKPEMAPVVVNSVKMLDRVLGVAMTSLFAGYDDPRRRLLYGRAGEYRCGHTIEYRVPCPMLGAHPATFNLMWDLGRTAWWIGMKGMEFLWDAKDDEVRHTINQSDVTQAHKILKRNQKMLTRMLEHSYNGDKATVAAGVKAILGGIDEVIANPTDIKANWRIGKRWQGEAEGHEAFAGWYRAVHHFGAKIE